MQPLTHLELFQKPTLVIPEVALGGFRIEKNINILRITSINTKAFCHENR
jgi:hypothetical protein